jgi:hypothetical protein
MLIQRFISPAGEINFSWNQNQSADGLRNWAPARPPLDQIISYAKTPRRGEGQNHGLQNHLEENLKAITAQNLKERGRPAHSPCGHPALLSKKFFSEFKRRFFSGAKNRWQPKRGTPTGAIRMLAEEKPPPQEIVLKFLSAGHSEFGHGFRLVFLIFLSLAFSLSCGSKSEVAQAMPLGLWRP